MIMVYKPKAGGEVIGRFVNEKGEPIIPDSVVAAKGTQVGTPYESKKDQIITVNGRKYRLKEVKGEEKGKVSNDKTVITYVYEDITSSLLAPNTGIFQQSVGAILVATLIAAISAVIYFFREKILAYAKSKF